MIMDPKDRAALALVGFVGIFIVGSMIALVVMAFTGATGGENVWAGMFSLTTAILGGIGGYLGGTAVEARRHENTNVHKDEQES